MHRMWTEEEKEYLQKVWGEKSVKDIAKKLKRSEEAIISKAEKMSLGGLYRASEYINANTIAKTMGIDIHAVTDYWILKCELKAQKKALNKLKTWFIKLDDLMEWLKNNQDIWDSRRIELYGFGTEPEWLKEKRKRDLELPRNQHKKWSKRDEQILINYCKMGKKKDEIALILNRSKTSIQSKINRLKEKGLLKKDKIMCKWSPKEENIFKVLEKQGLSDVEIAEKLGRETRHITDHRRNLRKKGLYEGYKIQRKEKVNAIL